MPDLGLHLDGNQTRLTRRAANVGCGTAICGGSDSPGALQRSHGSTLPPRVAEEAVCGLARCLHVPRIIQFHLSRSQYIPSALASILFAVFPFLVMLLMPLFIKDEKVTKRAVFGVGLGFAGVVLIFAEPLQLKGEALYGMLLFLLSPVAAAMGTVSIKAFLRDEPVLQMITLQMGLGAFLLCIVAALTEDLGRFEITAVSVGSILYLSICGSIVAFGVYYWLLKRIRLISMSLVALVTPVVAMLIGYLVLGEVLAPLDYVGAALVLTGVAVVNVRFRLPSRLASVVSGNNSTAC